jgi:U3 small nucleolar RNA-associated protein 10
MSRNTEVTRFVGSLLSKAMHGGHLHRALVAFHTGVLLEYIARSDDIEEGIVALLLPTILEPLQSESMGSSSMTIEVTVSRV